VLILHRLSPEALTTLLERAEEAEGVPLPSPNPRAKR
jgi:hypothetical protein